MDTEFGLMKNLMPQMIGNLYQIIKLSKGDPDAPTLIESIKGPYKANFTETTTQDIKEMEQRGT